MAIRMQAQEVHRGGERMLSLQWLRALAALGVVLYHAEMGANVYQHASPEVKTFAVGGLGVLLFFIVSGFVIATAAAQRPRSPRSFLLGRVARLYPAYLFTAAVFIAILALLPRVAFNHSPEISWERVLRTLAFDFGQMGGYVYVGWTLFYELCFYLVFSLVALQFNRLCRTSWFTWSLAAGLMLCAGFGWIRVGAFLLGVVLFLITERVLVWPCKPNLGLTGLLLSVGAFGLESPQALACAAVVLTLVLLERGLRVSFALPPMLWLGDASYSIYLIQVLSISASLKLAQRLCGGTAVFVPVAIGLSLLSTVAAGLAMRRWIEKPGTALTLRWGERLLGGAAARKG